MNKAKPIGADLNVGSSQTAGARTCSGVLRRVSLSLEQGRILLKIRALKPLTVAADVRRLRLNFTEQSLSLLTSAATRFTGSLDLQNWMHFEGLRVRGGAIKTMSVFSLPC